MTNITVDVQRGWSILFDNSVTPVNQVVQMQGNVRNPDGYSQLVFGNWGNTFNYDPSQSTNTSLNRFQTVAEGVTYYESDMWTFILSRMNANSSSFGLTFVSGAIYDNPNNPTTIRADWNQTDVTAYDYIKNKPSIGAKSFATPSRSVNTAFQISTTRDAQVVYSIPVTSSATVLAGSQVSCTFQYADNAGMSTNVVSLPGDQFGISSGVLVTGISSLKFIGIIPAGKYVKIVPTNIAGSPTLGSVTAQEVLL